MSRVFVRLLRLGFVVAALFALSRLIHKEDVIHARALLTRVGWPLALVLLPTLVAMALDAAGWRLIVATLGNQVSWRRMMELRLSVEALVLALPGGSLAGEAAKVALLTRRAGVPAARATASLALTKACLISADAIYLGGAAAWVGIAMLAGRGPPGALPVLLALGGAALTAGVGGALFALLRKATLAARFAELLRRIPIARLRRWLDTRRDGTSEIDAAARSFFDAPVAARARCFVPFSLEWFVEGAETWIILACLNVPLGIGETFLLDGLGSLLRVLVFFVPAGLGVQDAAMILLLGGLGIPDPIVTGTALVFIKRTKEVFWIVAGAMFLAARRDLWRRSR